MLVRKSYQFHVAKSPEYVVRTMAQPRLRIDRPFAQLHTWEVSDNSERALDLLHLDRR
jgi:hypothetical protein